MTDHHATGQAAFRGAKLMLFLGPRLLVIRRDDKAGIPWPGFLDFPGGGREGDESPEDCALRETREEVGLTVTKASLVWRHAREADAGRNWFFAAHLPETRVTDVHLGSEGTSWTLMAPAAFLERGDAIPHFRDMLRLYLAEHQT
ncbi:NUDIX hydrolase [Thalassococcus sp. BH17M4-6]|uniref:NUDIX hydrolase n=1 Tax=Thalassococcus sp. BH17M4-6 TaxID=3413148 RepID=UPI003BEACA58